MPIQGKKTGSQNEQRIYKEYDQRYEVLRTTLLKYDCVAIRIDKEHPIEQLVARIKEEIKKSSFIIADITDERPSCYFEAGFAEGLKIPVIYVASEESVIKPGEKTKIHFDIHMNVNLFTNIDELIEKVDSTIQKNKEKLFKNENEILIT
jgi:nucleoside 2-deoxyribosyltransferase